MAQNTKYQEMSFNKVLTDPAYILNNNNEMIASHDTDGKYLFVNDTFLKITGYTKEELIGKNPYDFFHPDDKELIKKEGHLPAIGGKDSTLVEFRFIAKNQEYLWLQTQTQPINKNGEVIGLITSSRDVSSVIDLATTAEVSNMLFDQSSQMAVLGAWEVNVDPFKINWSKTVYDIHEVDYSVEPGLVKALDFFVGDDRTKVEKHFEELMNSGTPYDLEVRFKTAKGNLKWVRSIGKAQLRNGKVWKVYGVLQDVTNAVEDKIKLKELAQFLTRQKQQMEQFNQIVSHNLRSPIANLGVLLNYYDESEDEEERAQYIKFLKQSSDSLQDLLNDLVDTVKVLNDKEIPQEPISIETLITKVKRILALEISNAGAKVTLNKVEWESVKYAPIYLESIMMNLVSNAIKYRSEDRAPEIRISAILNEDGEKVLQVSDNGMGINMKRHGEKLFKLHTTFARNKSGKGLGLFMTKQQIEAMGGEIEVESELGVGTTFNINLVKYRV